MDMREWFLRNEPPAANKLRALVKHTPCSDYRSPSVLKLFLAGFECGFKLTTADGTPTHALHVMARIMGAQLCQAKDLPDHERRAFGKDDGALINQLSGAWYLREISDRVRAAQSSTAMPMYRDKWHFGMLPGLDGAYITYKEEGKRRKRQCWLALCHTNWELNDDVYHGIFRWTREWSGPPERANGFREAPWPDAYTLLQEHPALESAAGPGAPSGGLEAPCAAPAEGLPPVARGVQHGPAEGPVAAAGD